MDDTTGNRRGEKKKGGDKKLLIAKKIFACIELMWNSPNVLGSTPVLYQ